MLSQNRPIFLPGTITLTTGTAADYRTLERFHYVPARPATFAAVVVARWTPDPWSSAAGPPRVIGVAVLSYPSALNRTRHHVFGLKSVRFGERLRWVNASVRTVSRVIVHPQFRSLGLSTRLIHAVAERCETPYVEASARMGRAHPLFERAGFTRVEPATPEEPLYFWRATAGSLARVLAGESEVATDGSSRRPTPRREPRIPDGKPHPDAKIRGLRRGV